MFVFICIRDIDLCVCVRTYYIHINISSGATGVVAAPLRSVRYPLLLALVVFVVIIMLYDIFRAEAYP